MANAEELMLQEMTYAHDKLLKEIVKRLDKLDGGDKAEKSSAHKK